MAMTLGTIGVVYFLQTLEQALNLGIFKSIEAVSGGVTLSKLAKAKNYCQRPLEKFLDCLTSMGLLRKTLLENKGTRESQIINAVE